MLHNQEFLDYVLSNEDNIYLSFKNELDLLSGFEKNDPEKDKLLISKVYEKTKLRFNRINKAFSNKGSIDENLIDQAGSESIFETIGKLDISKVEPLSYEKKDIVETALEKSGDPDLPFEDFNDEVQVKRLFDEQSSEYEKLELHIFILSRVFRNIEVDDQKGDLDDEIFSFILNSTCNLGFLLIEDIIKISQNQGIQEIEEKFGLPKELFKLIGGMLPLIVQDFFYNAVGHINLEIIIKEKIDELEKSSDQNQFQLFILYFTLLDLNLKSNKKYLDQIFGFVSYGVLKASVLTKLLYYLVFKAYNDKNLVNFLKDKFRKYQIKVNPKIDFQELDKKMSEFEKLTLIKRNSEKLPDLPE